MSDQQRVVVIGSGPAGYTAGVYLARAGLAPVVLAGEKWGGQLMLTTQVENYPGFPGGIMGPKLMEEMRVQAERFGAKVLDKDVTKVDFSKGPFKIWAGEAEYEAETVIITTGAKSKPLGVPGETEFMGRGVSTCAVCDAPFYKGKDQTYVVGGGDAAMEEALALARYAKKVGVIHRRNSLKASKIMEQRVKEKANIEFLWNKEVVEIKGNSQATSMKVQDVNTGEVEELRLDGIFIAIGHEPATEVFQGKLALNQKGYIVTRLGLEKASVELAQRHLDGQRLVEYLTMTSVEGVFAAGDVVDFKYRQAVTAAGMGCMAALDVEKYLTGTVGGW